MTDHAELPDFTEAFGVGVPGETPHPVDIGGVVFSAIQGLHEMAQKARTELDDLRAQTDAAVQDLDALRQRLEQLRRS